MDSNSYIVEIFDYNFIIPDFLLRDGDGDSDNISFILFLKGKELNSTEFNTYKISVDNYLEQETNFLKFPFEIVDNDDNYYFEDQLKVVTVKPHDVKKIDERHCRYIFLKKLVSLNLDTTESVNLFLDTQIGRNQKPTQFINKLISVVNSLERGDITSLKAKKYALTHLFSKRKEIEELVNSVQESIINNQSNILEEVETNDSNIRKLKNLIQNADKNEGICEFIEEFINMSNHVIFECEFKGFININEFDITSTNEFCFLISEYLTDLGDEKYSYLMSYKYLHDKSEKEFLNNFNKLLNEKQQENYCRFLFNKYNNLNKIKESLEHYSKILNNHSNSKFGFKVLTLYYNCRNVILNYTETIINFINFYYPTNTYFLPMTIQKIEERMKEMNETIRNIENKRQNLKSDNIDEFLQYLYDEEGEVIIQPEFESANEYLNYQKFNAECEIKRLNQILISLPKNNNQLVEESITDIKFKNPTHKISLLEQLGVIDFLKTQYPILKDNNTKLASLLGGILEITDKTEKDTLRKNLSYLDPNHKKTIRNEKSDREIRAELLKLGIEI